MYLDDEDEGWELRAARRVPAEQLTLEQRHERDDLLPRKRVDVYEAIKQASGIDDHDYAQADKAYREWRDAKRGMKWKPPAWQGGELDSMQQDRKRKARGISSLLEGFEDVATGSYTWRDIAKRVMPSLREVPGFENARLPDDVLQRHIMQDEEMRAEGRAPDAPVEELPPLPANDDYDDPWGPPSEYPEIRQRWLDPDATDKVATLRMLIDEATALGVSTGEAAEVIRQYLDVKVPTGEVPLLAEEIDAYIEALALGIEAKQKEQRFAKRRGAPSPRPASNVVQMPRERFPEERISRTSYEVPDNELVNVTPELGSTLALPTGDVFKVGTNGAIRLATEAPSDARIARVHSITELARVLGRDRKTVMVRIVAPREGQQSLFATAVQESEMTVAKTRDALLSAAVEVEDAATGRLLLAAVAALEGHGAVDRVLAAISARKTALRSKGAYTWYRFNGARAKTLKKRGRTVKLEKGSRFGIREATSSKGAMRLITEELGPTHVFSLEPKAVSALLKNATAGKGGKAPAKKAAAKKAPAKAPGKTANISSSERRTLQGLKHRIEVSTAAQKGPSKQTYEALKRKRLVRVITTPGGDERYTLTKSGLAMVTRKAPAKKAASKKR